MSDAAKEAREIAERIVDLHEERRGSTWLGVIAAEIEPLIRERDEAKQRRAETVAMCSQLQGERDAALKRAEEAERTHEELYRRAETAEREWKEWKARCEQSQNDHHALGEWPKCPHCVRFFQQDEDAAVRNAELQARAEEAEKDCDARVMRAVNEQAQRDAETLGYWKEHYKRESADEATRDHHADERGLPVRTGDETRERINSDHPCCIGVGDAVRLLDERDAAIERAEEAEHWKEVNWQELNERIAALEARLDRARGILGPIADLEVDRSFQVVFGEGFETLVKLARAWLEEGR